MGQWKYKSTDFSSRYHWVEANCWFYSCPIYPRGKEAGWTPVGLDVLEKRNISLPGIEPRFFGHIVYSLVSMLTKLAQLPNWLCRPLYSMWVICLPCWGPQENDEKLGDHSNFWVGHRNFTVWTKYFRFKIESMVPFFPASPAARKAKLYFIVFPTSYLVESVESGDLFAVKIT